MQTWRNSELMSNFWCNFRFFYHRNQCCDAFCVSVFRACTLKFVFPHYCDYDEILFSRLHFTTVYALNIISCQILILLH